MNNDLLQKDTVNIAGLMNVSVFNSDNLRALKLEREIEHHVANKKHLMEQDVDVRAKLTEWHHKIFREMVAEFQRMFLVRQYQATNLITTRGRSVLADRLANVTTYSGVINYGALGTGTTPVANGDTQLQTETYRKVVASGSASNNIAFVDFFYAKADTNGTYQEFGTFIDGTGTANSGRIFTHMLTGGWVKSSTESMTVACQYTIT